MQKYSGTSVFGGVAIGRLFVYVKDGQQVRRTAITDIPAEIERFDKARLAAKKDLDELYEKAVKEAGQDNAEIFTVHKMMLEDDSFKDSVYNIIEEQSVNAEYAVATTEDNLYEIFMGLEDEYMRGRAADIRDISERVISKLSGNNATLTLYEPSIVMATELVPSETVQLDREKLLGFVTLEGSKNSHTAILARNMNIPALIGIKPDKELNGKLAVIDGYEGCIVVDPDEEYLAKMQAKKKSDDDKKRLLLELKGKENVTSDGRKIDIYANIGTPSDFPLVTENDAGGIGLFRSEFLYLKKEDFPTEEEQFTAYKSVAMGMSGKPVVIRTLDIGADKQADYFKLDKEENPAMGMRAIRICLKRPEIFKTQLRAILRASNYGNIWIMFPMIISLWEVKKAKSILEEVRRDLEIEEVPIKPVKVGIMIETPAAVMMTEELAAEVDFFSIGTNDLTQYTEAIDRQNPKLADFYDAHHPAVLKMIEMTVKNAHKHGTYVGICGELAADTELTEKFIEYGVDELSVSPSMVLKVREKVRSL